MNFVSDCWTTFWILIPFVLFSANNFVVVSGSPLGDCTISTSLIEIPDKVAFKIPLLICCPIPVLTIIIFGGSV